MQQQYAATREVTTVRLTRPMLYAMMMGFMSLVGTVFWTAGYAAGLHSTGLLATLFAMGATSALLLLVLWFLSQVRTLEAAERSGHLAERR